VIGVGDSVGSRVVSACTILTSERAAFVVHYSGLFDTRLTESAPRSCVACVAVAVVRSSWMVYLMYDLKKPLIE
jgi:hypothetical protein